MAKKIEEKEKELEKLGRIERIKEDYYEILDVEKDAKVEKIKEKYLEKKKGWFVINSNNKNIILINGLIIVEKAYFILSCPKLRGRYDFFFFSELDQNGQYQQIIGGEFFFLEPIISQLESFLNQYFLNLYYAKTGEEFFFLYDNVRQQLQDKISKITDDLWIFWEKEIKDKDKYYDNNETFLSLERKAKKILFDCFEKEFISSIDSFSKSIRLDNSDLDYLKKEVIEVFIQHTTLVSIFVLLRWKKNYCEWGSLGGSEFSQLRLFLMEVSNDTNLALRNFYESIKLSAEKKSIEVSSEILSFSKIAKCLIKSFQQDRLFFEEKFAEQDIYFNYEKWIFSKNSFENFSSIFLNVSENKEGDLNKNVQQQKILVSNFKSEEKICLEKFFAIFFLSILTILAFSCLLWVLWSWKNKKNKF